MVTNRQIIVSNGVASIVLTTKPYYVKNITGFDSLKITNVTKQGYSQDGSSLVNSYINEREMTIEGQIKADTVYEMQTLRDYLENLFKPKTDLQIIHTYGDITRVITARATVTPQFTFSEVSKIQNYTVSLIAVEPYWRDRYETLVEMAETQGNFHFPLAIPEEGVIFGVKNTSTIVNIYNSSSIPVGMNLRFIANGYVKNPAIINLETRESLKFNCEMHQGDYIDVQTGSRKKAIANIGGVESSAIGKLDISNGNATFIELNSGDNVFRYLADEGENLLVVKVYFYNKYSGV